MARRKDTRAEHAEWVRWILQQVQWRKEGRCPICGGEHSSHWHARMRAEEREREAMLRSMDE